MANHADCLIGLEGVMSFYDMISDKSPFFVIWEGATIKRLQSLSDSPDEARALLNEYLELLRDTGASNEYSITVYPKFSEVYKKGEETMRMYFKLNDWRAADWRTSARVSGNGEQGVTVINRREISDNSSLAEAIGKLPDLIDQKLASVSERIAAIEARDVEPAIEQKSMIDHVMGFLDHPVIGPQIGGLIGLAIAGISNVLNVPRPAVPAINGVTTMEANTETQTTALSYDDAIDLALDRLAAHCDLANDLTRLADMAEKNPAMFKFLLDSLRKG